jgi:iron complex outermembrane receptor protein
MRGFSQGHGGSSLLDGAQIFPMSMNTVDKERVEILTGLSGMLYGPGRVGGTQNYVLKRPTPDRYATWTMGFRNRNSYNGHLDLGGPIDDEGKFGYRLNLAGRDGETAFQTQNIREMTVSAAFDWHITDNFLLRLNGSRNKYKVDGTRRTYDYPADFDFSFAPDASAKYNVGGGTESNNENYGLGIDWKIADFLKIRANYQHFLSQQVKRHYPTANTINRDHSITVGAPNNPAQRNAQEYDSGYVYADFTFDTGPLDHALTMGYSLFNQKHYGSSFTNGAYTPWKEDNNKTRNRSLQFGDVISFGEHWQVIGGFNYVTLRSYSNNEPLEQKKLTPSISLVYKPVESWTLYASYIESLENGTIVANTTGTNAKTYTNDGEILPPYMSKQYEFGAKTELGGVLLTLALFQIEKPSSLEINNNNGTYTLTQDGLQQNRGLEFSATGKVTDDLSLYGGFTLLRARIKKSAYPAMVNSRATGVAEKMLKVFAKYDVPFLEGLSIKGGAFYTGDIVPGAGRGQSSTTPNKARIPGVTTFDLGASYHTIIKDKPVSFDLNVQNLADKNYWISAGFLGAPRTISLSMKVDFK